MIYRKVRSEMKSRCSALEHSILNRKEPEGVDPAMRQNFEVLRQTSTHLQVRIQKQKGQNISSEDIAVTDSQYDVYHYLRDSVFFIVEEIHCELIQQ